MVRPKFNPTSEDRKIAHRYRSLREGLTKSNGKKCTYRDLAIELMNEPNYSARIFEIESASAKPSIRDMKLYHDYFKVPYEYLLGETDSMHYENMTSFKDLGLSDDVINALKLWIEKSPKCNIVFVLNQIFKIGYGYSFFNTLSHYFYGACNELQMTEFSINGAKINFNEIKSDNVNIIGEDITRLVTINKKDVEYIFQQKLYDLLKEIKQELKTKGLECESELYNGFDTDACLSEFYENLDETITDKDFEKYLNKIRRFENG